MGVTFRVKRHDGAKSDGRFEAHLSNRNALAVLSNIGLPPEHQGEIDAMELLEHIGNRRTSDLDSRETEITEAATIFGLTAEGIDERVERLNEIALHALSLGQPVEWL